MNRTQIVIYSCLLVFLFSVCSFQNDMFVVNNNLQSSSALEDIDISTLTTSNAVFTWTARDSPMPSEFLTDEVLGDHIIIHATSTDSPVIESDLFLDSSRNYNAGLLLNEDGSFNPFSDNIQLGDSHFSWLILNGIELGTLLHLVFNFDTSNCDLMAWAGNTNTSNWYYSNNILQTKMVTDSNPEICFIDWPVGSQISIYVAVYNHDTTSGGTGSLEIYFDSLSNANALGDTVTYDTYRKNANVVKSVLYVANMGGNSRSYGYLPATSFVNYFPPEVDLLTPVAGDNWIDGQYNITWSASDRNSDDGIWFELFLLHSEPEYNMELGTGEFNYDSSHGFYYYTIDTTGIQNDNCIVWIVAHDNDTTIAQNWPDLQASDGSGSFIFGNVFVSTTEFSNISTVTTNNPQSPLNLLLIVNIGLSGTILVFVILIFRGKKDNKE